MKKTHEKSRIYTVTGTAKLKNPEKGSFTDRSNRTEEHRRFYIFS